MSRISIDVTNEVKDRMEQYGAMARSFMNKPFDHPNAIVGNYEWHQEFPYERFLLCRLKTENPPDLADEPKIPCDGTSVIADFGCGPGRMIERMKNVGCAPPGSSGGFLRVDGIDVSTYALDYARTVFPDSKFYASSGIDCGDTPDAEYDLIYSTITLQHVASRTIRKNLYSEMRRILKPGGEISLQVAFHPTYAAGVWSADTTHASYFSDFFGAGATNGHADMVINERDLPRLKEDLSVFFDNIQFVFAQVDNKYENLNGKYHAPYWASHWLFIHGTKVATS